MADELDDYEAPEPETNEQEPDDFQSALADMREEEVQDESQVDDEAPVDEAGEAEEKTPAPVAEGPSAAMAELARRSGVPKQLIAQAASDAELGRTMRGIEEFIAESQGASAPESQALEALAMELKEEDADEPVRKQFQALVDHVNKLSVELKSAREAADEAKKFKEQQQQAAARSDFEKVRAPFDEALDEFPEVFGDSKRKLTPEELAGRAAVWETYKGLNIDPQMAAERLKRKAYLAVQDERPDLWEKKTKQDKIVRQQPKRALGGATPGRTVRGTETFAEALAAMRNGKTLADFE